MKKIIFISWCINISIWTFIYIINAFAYWKLYNPFQWIIAIPTYSVEGRGVGLFMLLLWQVGQLWILNMVFKDKEKKTQCGDQR